MIKDGITPNQVIDLLEPYCRESGGAQMWPVEDTVAKVTIIEQGF